MDAIITRAEALKAKMDLFPPPSEPLLQLRFFAKIRQVNIAEHVVAVDLHYGRIKGQEFASLADYWVHTCKIVEDPKAHPGQKVKALYEFDITLQSYYMGEILKTVKAANAPKADKDAAQQRYFTFMDVRKLWQDLLRAVPQRAYKLYIPQSVIAGTSKDIPELSINNRELENRIFFDLAELNKLDKFVHPNNPLFRETVPYKVVLAGIEWIPVPDSVLR